MKILIIGPSWIGDMVMTHSLCRILKKIYSKSIIDMIAPVWNYQLLLRMPEINKPIKSPLKHNVFNIKEILKFSCNLRDRCYDKAYILPNSFKSALIPFFANIPHRIGWLGEMRYLLLNDIRILNKIAWPMMIERYITLAYDKNKVRNSKELPKPLLLPYLQVNKDERIQLCKYFNIDNKRPIIGFCPGAEFGQIKCWPFYHYATLATKLINNNFQIMLFGSIKDFKIGEKIFETLNIKTQIHCFNLIGKTDLDQAIVLLSSCKAIVTNDSGLMHVAAALDCPLIALYGLSSPDFTPPLSKKAKVIRLINGYYNLCKYKSIILNKYHKSMININPQYVFKELIKLLNNL